MSPVTHDEFPDREDAIAAYALDALDAAEARALEAHLATCAECRAELAELRRAVNGIGLSSIAEEPPADLRAKIVNQAKASASVTRGTRSSQSSTSDRPSTSSIVPWMVAAASLALVAASGFYGLMQRQQTATALAGKVAADARVLSLQRQINGLSERIAVLSAPDAVQIKLAGQPDAPGATASVVMSPTKGMVLTALNLPQLAAGKIYQLWVVTKSAPVSIGTFAVAADGSVTGTMPITAAATLDPVAVAVTIEPAGGVPSPTGPKVLVGLLAPQ